MNLKKLYLSVFIIGFLVLYSPSVKAELIGGVEFPKGKISFADAVVNYLPGTFVASQFASPSNAVGIPDYNGVPTDGSTFVSLGNGGTIILRFVDNSLTTSGSSSKDLWIFEVGPTVEATDVYISKDGENWISVGRVEGSTRGIDIDSYIGKGVIAGEQYFYVKLTDVADDNFGTSADSTGADIDAVGAISSTVIDTCVDSDNDGVPNQWDKCPDTPAGSYVDKNGCPATGLYTQAQLDTAKQAAIQSCKDNPASCGLFGQTQLDQAVSTATASMYNKTQLDQAVSDERKRWDANGDNKIGLEDVIYMLQVIVGLRP